MAIGINEWIQLIPLWLPLVGALFLALIGRLTKERNKVLLGAISVVILFIALWFLISPFPPFQGLYFQLVNAGFTPIDIVYFVTTPLDPSIGAAFLRIDILSVFMSVIFIFLGFFVALYSIKYMEHDTRLSIYYALLLTLVGGMVGVTMAGDFFTLFILWETMSISSYVLVAFRKDEAEPLEAGIKYLFLSAVGSTLILFTMSLLYGLTGTLNIYQIGPALSLIVGGATPGSPIQGLLLITIVGLIIGFGVKAAIAPLSTWLPDAHPAAPSGISAMLSGVVIMTGAYAIIRTLILFYNPADFPYYGAVVSWFALFTMIYGNLMALTQKDLKRLLAYSTIVNVGYIIYGFSIAMMQVAQPAQLTSVTGSLFHITAHMLSKGMLFLISGIFLHSLHTRDLDKLRGVGRKMPLTILCLTIGALSLAGVPPLIGFYSKFFIIWGAIQAGAYIATIILVLMSAFSVVYYLRIIQVLVFAEPSPEAATVKPTHPILLFVISVLTIFIIGIGLFPGFFIEVAEFAAQGALGLLP